jgi:hypothetical protein
VIERRVVRDSNGRIERIIERPLPQLDEILMERTQEIVVVAAERIRALLAVNSGVWGPLPIVFNLGGIRPVELVSFLDPEALKAEILGRLRADERVRIVLDVVKPVLRDHEQPRA